MDPISVIATAISSIKTATEIAQILKVSESSIAEAENKLRIADIMNALADTKIAISEMKDILVAKDEEIASLKKRLEDKRNIDFRNGIYIEKDEAGKQIANYCPRCLDVDIKKVRLREQDNGFLCMQCRSFYPNSRYYASE